MFVIYFIILAALLLLLYRPKSIDYFSAKVIPTGPFLFNKKPLYVYNPSIAYSDNGEIIGVSRLTGKISDECNRYTAGDFTENSDVAKDISQYPSSHQTNHSSVILWELSLLPEFKILPLFSRENVCNSSESKEFEYSLGIEDPRLFRFRNSLWLYGHFRGSFPTDPEKKCLHIPVIVKLSRLDHIIRLRTDSMKLMEKNWMPFEYQDTLYFVYEISPHTILSCDTTTGHCTQVYRTDNLSRHPLARKHLGGGAPAAFFHYKGKPYFLSVAHTRENTPRIIRKNFFYIFRAQPPFDIILIGKEFDVMDDHRDIEFGSGVVLSHDKKEIILSCGVSDCYSVISRYSLKEVMAGMTKVGEL